jgi:hypothetical protein
MASVGWTESARHVGATPTAVSPERSGRPAGSPRCLAVRPLGSRACRSDARGRDRRVASARIRASLTPRPSVARDPSERLSHPHPSVARDHPSVSRTRVPASLATIRASYALASELQPSVQRARPSGVAGARIGASTAPASVRRSRRAGASARLPAAETIRAFPAFACELPAAQSAVIRPASMARSSTPHRIGGRAISTAPASDRRSCRMRESAPRRQALRPRSIRPGPHCRQTHSSRANAGFPAIIRVKSARVR